MEDEDALKEVLARLPVKSLIRFTSVCKYWLSLIKSPEFATKHYVTRLNLFRKQNQIKSQYDNEDLHQNRDEYDKYCHDSIITCFTKGLSMSIFSYENLSFQTAFKFRPAVPYEPFIFGHTHLDAIFPFTILGPCNGIFLIVLTKLTKQAVYLLWNPATREVFRLPNSINGTNISRFDIMGFGFDHVSNDYKVVNFDIKSGSLLLYSLTRNAWRKDAGLSYDGVNGTRYISRPSSNGRMINWLIRIHEDSSLLSFDVVDEAFLQTPVPKLGESSSEFVLLHQYSNQMYPAMHHCDYLMEKAGVQIWVLKEYGPKGYWIKQQYITVSERVCHSDFVFWKGEAAMFINTIDKPQCYKEVVSSYKFTTQEVTSLKVYGDIDHIVCYTESLVSIVRLAGETIVGVGEEEKDLCVVVDQIEHVQQQDDDCQEALYIETCLFQQQCALREELQQDYRPDDDDDDVDPSRSNIHSDDDDVDPYRSDIHSDDDDDINLNSGAADYQDPYRSDIDSLVVANENLGFDQHNEEHLRIDDQVVFPSTIIDEPIVPFQQHDDDLKYDDDDTFSTDSAFQYLDPRDVYDPFHSDIESINDDEDFLIDREKEYQRLSKLPYCLCEVNQPLGLNPCIF